MEVKQVPNMLDKETQIYNNDPHLFVFDDEVTFLLVKFLFGCAKKKCWIWKEVVSSNIKIKIDILFKLLFHIYIYKIKGTWNWSIFTFGGVLFEINLVFDEWIQQNARNFASKFTTSTRVPGRPEWIDNLLIFLNLL